MWKINLWKAATAWLIVGMLSGCTSDNPGSSNSVNNPQESQPFKAVAPTMDADSMFSFVERQLSFGPRIPGSKGHAACAEWMVSKFNSYGAKTQIQSGNFITPSGKNIPVKNVIASYLPEKTTGRLMITAHWDTRPLADKDAQNPNAPVPGANDGGSGVAVILEIARQFSMKAPSVGVDLILWDAEDSGNYNDEVSWCIGSQYWVKNPHVTPYRASFGINLDMVGAKDARFTKDEHSSLNAPAETDKVWNLAHNLGFGSYFPLNAKGFASIDDHYFIMQGASLPMVEVIDRNVASGEFFPHWHTTTDNLDQIDRNTLKAVGQTVLEVIYRER